MSTTGSKKDDVKVLKERVTSRLFLTAEQANQLRIIGEESARNEDDDQPHEFDDPKLVEPIGSKKSTAILVQLASVDSDNDGNHSWYDVVVRDRIGVIALDSITLIVQPKIPFEHFAHIAKYAFANPQSRQGHTSLDTFDSFHDLIAQWFLDATRPLLPFNLLRDYRLITNTLTYSRGNIDPLATSLKLLAGRLEVDCTYEEFDIDIPLNRLIKEGLRIVSQLPRLSLNMHREARSLLRLIPDVGDFVPTDIHAESDRRAHFHGYEPASTLARHLVQSSGRSLTSDLSFAQTFLMYTPSIVEEGIRNILSGVPGSDFLVQKLSIPLPPLRPATPDLVFLKNGEVEFVGDVKYKTVNGWEEIRGDLYQSVFFSAAFRQLRSLVIAFTATSEDQLPVVSVGNHEVHGILWNLQLGVEEARNRLIDDVHQTLTKSLSTQLAI